jgi:aspartyl aminopeptidase
MASLKLKNSKFSIYYLRIFEYRDKWNLTPGKSYFFTRNQATIVAFSLGNKCNEGVDLLKIVGCHTDSPCLKLAPVSKVDNKAGFQQLNMQTYGGGIWRTWFDRDLGLAGKVVYKDKETE